LTQNVHQLLAAVRRTILVLSGKRCSGTHRGDTWFGPFLCRTSLPSQVKRTVDQADVTVSLGEIAQHSAAQRIDLFGQQAHVIAA
jgi:hypothetical protein